MDTAKRAAPVRLGQGFAMPLVAGACAVYGASVAAEIGGSWRDVLAAALAGLLGGVFHGSALTRRSADLGRTFTAALSATFAVLALPIGPSASHIGRALFGGLAMLAPVALLSTSAADIAGGAARTGLLRLAQAGLRALALAGGIAAAFAVEARLTAGSGVAMAAGAPASGAALALPVPAIVGLVALGGLALTVCVQARWRDAPWMVAGVLVGYGSTAVSHLMFGPTVGAFASAFCLGVVAIVAGRVADRTAALIMVPGLLQLGVRFLGSERALHLLGTGSFADAGAIARFAFGGVALASGLLLAETALGRDVRRARRDRDAGGCGPAMLGGAAEERCGAL